MYQVFRHVHLICIVLSISGFMVRVYGAQINAQWSQSPWVRRLRDVVDTLLLLSAGCLMYWRHEYPGHTPWLTAKLAGLIVYVALGMLALRWGKSASQRRWAAVAALLTVGWMVSVALTKQPAGVFGLIGA